jgi:hypothetical protein
VAAVGAWPALYRAYRARISGEIDFRVRAGYTGNIPSMH